MCGVLNSLLSIYFNRQFKGILLSLRTVSSYKNTVLLPRTTFPYKIAHPERKKRDKQIEKDAKFEELYDWQLQHNCGEKFTLHDGPPYANGDVHVGHSVNKILKDITLRSKLLNGKQVHYKPGWDFHGLPIELMVTKGEKSSVPLENALEVRKKAFNVAKMARLKQLKVFKTWGLLGDWKNHYYTCHEDYITRQLNFFYLLYEKNLIYRDYKPVFWSPSNRTSLAEAELEYNHEHKSKSVYVKFKIEKYPAFIKDKIGSSDLYALIWTTTPWTLPANQGICYAEHKEYCILQSHQNSELYIVATEMVPMLKNTLNTDFTVLQEFPGSELENMSYLHPLVNGKEFPLLPASHVTMSKGSGLVHMAPNHGLEDYAAAQLHKIPLDPCLVDDDGCFLPVSGDALVGKDVLTSGNEEVLKLMENNIVCEELYMHSYPYDWRSHKPVIIKSSHQWFIDISAIKEQAMACLDDVEIIPDKFRKTLKTQLEICPQWCISRQRVWGVPIPVFYKGCENIPVINRHIIDHLCELVQEKGIHFWWELSESELLPEKLRQMCSLPNENLHKGTDILDIWFDSGISWNCVLPEPQVSDLCLEGVDQIRGWFNSSLLTSIASRNMAPYKSLFFHGFTTDADGLKMSKSKGNVVNPVDIVEGIQKKIPAYGIDVLRWWVAYHASHHENIPVKDNIFQECCDTIIKIRNIVKFILGNLVEFDYNTDQVEMKDLRPVDQYMLHSLKRFLDKCDQSYNMMQYKFIARELLNYISNDVSAFYCAIIKDRLYCEPEDSVYRRACQTVLYKILDVVMWTLAPLVPHLAEEICLYHPDKDIRYMGAFRRNWADMHNSLRHISFPDSIIWANEVRNIIVRSQKRTTNMDALIFCGNKLMPNLKVLHTDNNPQSDLCELFQVSNVLIQNVEYECLEYDTVLQGNVPSKITGGDPENFTVTLRHSSMEICPRCRLSTTQVKSTLCQRCTNVVNVQKQECIS